MQQEIKKGDVNYQDLVLYQDLPPLYLAMSKYNVALGQLSYFKVVIVITN